MAKAGVSKPSLAKLGGTVACFMADGDVARAAQENGTTRADAAVEKAAREYPGAVLAVGNAPTALLRLEALIADGLRPALVVAVPVGFVNAAQSKELLQQSLWPHFTLLGRKGGSAVAAACINALADLALEKRGLFRFAAGRLEMVNPKALARLADYFDQPVGQRPLIVTEDATDNLYLSARNLPYVQVRDVQGLDPVSLVGADTVVVTTDAVKKIEEWLA